MGCSIFRAFFTIAGLTTACRVVIRCCSLLKPELSAGVSLFLKIVGVVLSSIGAACMDDAFIGVVRITPSPQPDPALL